MTVFYSKGYTAATVEAIAVEAGMSKKTLYLIFSSKSALFDALLVEKLYDIPIPENLDAGSPEEELTQLLLSLTKSFLDPERQALIRLVITDSKASPELTTVFERLEIGRDLNHIEKWIITHQDSGYLKVRNVASTARLLFGMTIAEPLLSALVQGPAIQSNSILLQQINEAVRIFLVGTGAIPLVARAVTVDVRPKRLTRSKI